MLGRQKFFSILLAVLILAGFLTTSWLSYEVARGSIEKHISNELLPLTTDKIYSEIQHDLFKPIFISSLMAQDTFASDWVLNGEKDPNKIIRYLQQIQNKNNTLTSFFASEKTGYYYHPNGILKKLSKDDPQDHWYFTFKNTPSSQVYGININHDDSYSDNMAVFVNYKMFDSEKQFIGVIGVGLALQTFKQLIERYQIGYNYVVYFVDEQGKITLQGNKNHQNLALKNRLKSTELTSNILNNTSTSFQYNVDGHKIYLNSRFLDEYNWHLVVEHTDINSEQQLSKTLQINIALSLLISFVVLSIAYTVFNRYQKKLVLMASTDKLSGLLNRQVFEPIILNNIEQCKRKKTNLTLVMLDIDHFKKVNDKYGHLTGDKVIQQVSQVCKAYSRESDAVCRWGGEEFIIMLNETSIDEAIKTVKRIQENLLDSNIKPKVTISFGITAYKPDEELGSFISRVDDALYKAKKNGRDCFVVHE